MSGKVLEGEKGAVDEKVYYDDVVFSLPLQNSSPSHVGKEVPLDSDDHERSRSPSPVYETIREKSAKSHANSQESTAVKTGTKSHKFLRRHVSDQLASTSLLGLFNRRSSNDSATPQPSRPRSVTAETLEGTLPDPGSIEGEVLTLMDLVRKHANSFPLRVTVEQGFCSNIEEGAISSDETYNVHFLKYTKVAYLSSKESPNHMYTVPFNSAVQFGLVYNPQIDIGLALQGKSFETVGDVMAVRPLPKLLRATRSYQGTNANSSVEENELLVVRSAKRPKVLGSPHLKVYSITTGETKSLPIQCAGNFTTKPHSLCLHLPEIVKHIPNVFPVEAVVYIERTTCNYEFVPESLIGEVVTLTHSSIETTLIATAYSCELSEEEEVVKPVNPEKVEIHDIPVNLDIEVKVDPLSAEDRQVLNATTMQLYSSFDPEKLIVCKPFSSSDCFQTQLQLYRVVHKDRRLEGTQIEMPKMAFANSLWMSGGMKRVNSLPDLLEASEGDTDSRAVSLSQRQLPPDLPPRETVQAQHELHPTEYEVPVPRSPSGTDSSPSASPEDGGKREHKTSQVNRQSLSDQSEAITNKDVSIEITTGTSPTGMCV